MIFVIDQYYLVISLLICLGWQICFFIVASCTRSDKVTDFAYGTNFVGLALILFLIGQVYSARRIVVFVFVALWGLRLALYLFARVLKEGKDARFDDTRDNLPKFALFWLAQFVTVWVISLPFTVMYSRIEQPKLDWRDGLGMALFIIGLLIETVADQQKFAFKNQPETRKLHCNVGLWSVSRHPNYFGEILVWWGIWALATPTFVANRWLYWTVVSPLYVGTILLFLSGIPTLEEPWNRKYGQQEAFRRYRARVPPLVLFIPSFYERFPNWLKLAVCCEFPLYAKSLEEGTPPAPVDGSDDLEAGWDQSAQKLYQNT